MPLEQRPHTPSGYVTTQWEWTFEDTSYLAVGRLLYPASTGNKVLYRAKFSSGCVSIVINE